jgi:NAD(P)-dependent dehydrogenase (short-subunit alcohol dehydrogenase family)
VRVAKKSILITGANRGIGHALVLEALQRGAQRVYAGTRSGLDITDRRVVPVALDVTNDRQIEQALAVNFFGMYKVSRAFLPLLKRSHGALVNNLSLMALAPLPLTPSYAVSKAAALSMTQSLPALLASHGVSVHAVFLWPVDTDMTRGFEIPKASPASVARGIFDGLECGEDDIFPDPMSCSIADGWRNGIAKEFERQYAPFVLQSTAL